MNNTKAYFLNLLFFSCLSVGTAQADPAPMNSASSGTTSSSNRIAPLPPLPAGQKAKPVAPAGSNPSYISSVRQNVAALSNQQASYFHPGILVFRGGVWEGSDHLLNLSKNIGIYVTIVKPDGDKLELSAEQLQKQVEAIFINNQITPTILTSEGQPPLPFFQIQILAYPIDKGYVACCEGRLFEAVNLQRFNFDPGMGFQAITWEKKSLQVGPTNKIVEQIQGSVQEIAQAFIERFEAYEKIRKEVTR